MPLSSELLETSLTLETGLAIETVEEVEAGHLHSAIEENWDIRDYFFYDVNGSVEEKDRIHKQRHIDIRAFTQREKWTAGVPGPQESLGGLPGLALTLTAGEVIASSFVPSINIATGFKFSDYLILALPSFPLAQVKLNESFIEFTSNPEGSFSGGPTVAIPLSESELTLISGNSQFKLKRFAIEDKGVNLSQVTAIRFKIKATGSATLTLAGLRLVSKDWGYAPIDFDNISGYWRVPVAPNGDPTYTKAFATQPILWRSDNPPGKADPRMIDANVGIMFFTGSQAKNNSFTIYLRETDEAFITQVDLDGKTMRELDKHPQPDLGISQFGLRDVGSLDTLPLNILDEKSMGDLDKIENPTSQSWISFKVSWGVDNTVEINNTVDAGYKFTHPVLATSSSYIAIISLEGTVARLRIHAIDSGFNIVQTPIFDTTAIRDSGTFKRRKGRIGWQANLEDLDAQIGPIHPRGMTFAEYVSAPFQSDTPVVGATLTANSTPNRQLFTGLEKLGIDSSTTVLSRDQARSVTGSSYRLLNNGGTNQGIRTNIFPITDLKEMVVSFDLWYPSNLPGLRVRLLSSLGAEVPLTLPFIYRDQWQKISITPGESLIHTGRYALVIEQPSAGVGSFWLDAVEIYQRGIEWSARAIADDPWESNDAPWTDFHELINGKGGVMFSARGTELQLRARAREQTTTIAGPPQIKPVYANLGRLVWPENKPNPTGPTANFTTAAFTPTVVTEFVKFPEKPDENILFEPAVNGTYIFWTDELGGSEENGSIRRSPLGGGSSTVLVKGELTKEFFASSIAIDETYIYFGHGAKISRCKLDGTGYEGSWITATGSKIAKIKGIAVDGTYIYWTDIKNGQIGRANKANPAAEGGPNMSLVTGISFPSYVRATGSNLFWGSKGNIEKSTLTGTERSVFYSRPGTIRGLAINGTEIFWTWDLLEGSYSSGVGRAKFNGSELTESFIKGSSTVKGIAANSEYIYWGREEAIARSTLNGNPLLSTFTSTSTPGSSPISLYEWNFGDGGVGLGSVVEHLYAKSGTYSVTLTVADSFGLRNSHIATVTI